MKKIQFQVITALVIAGLLISISSQACSPGSVSARGYYVVYDPTSSQSVTYDVYVCVSDECPSQGCQSAPIATLTYLQVGATQPINSNLISLNLPTDLQSYYYFKVIITVYRKVNGTVTGSATDYSYADYDSNAQTFTARKTIEINF